MEDRQMKAVIFDLDGTLIDTEKHYVRLGMEIAKEMGYDIPREVILSLRSLNRKFAAPKLRELYGDGFDYEYFRNTRKQRFEETLRLEGIEKKPGADEILSYLTGHGYRTALATATERERAEGYLRQVGLEDAFDCILSVSNVENGKPMPDVYLEVCKRLGEMPADCVAIEDSDNGVKSAYRAGLRVIMVPDLAPPATEVEPMLYGVAGQLCDLRKFL